MKPSSTAQMDEKQRHDANKKYQIIAPYLNGELKLSDISAQHKVPRRTLSFWVQRYETDGLCGLSRMKRKDKNENRTVSQDQKSAIEGIYLKSPHLSFAAIHRMIQEKMRTNYTDAPSYRSVCRILSSIPKQLVTLAHDGTKEYKNKFDLLYRHESLNPNETWQADHAQLDIMILNDNGKLQRPWLTVTRHLKWSSN